MKKMKNKRKKLVNPKDILVTREEHYFKSPIENALKNHFMPVISVYKNPKDYPKKYVARLHIVNAQGGSPTSYVFIADTLREVEEARPKDLTAYGRFPDDDPCIIQSWF